MTAQVGVTHLLVDGKENLMDGQPYLTAEGALVMEVNALIPHITGTRTQYDDKVNVLRIETEYQQRPHPKRIGCGLCCQ